MAARNPTSFTTWIDETLLESGKSILAATPNSVLNDQVFVLDMQRLVVTMPIPETLETGSTSFVDMLTFYLRNKDMCDVDGVSNDEIACEIYVYAKCTDGATSGEIRLTSGTAVADTSVTVVIPTGTTTAIWFKAGSTMNIKTNDNEDDITIAMRRTAGVATSVDLNGLAIIAVET